MKLNIPFISIVVSFAILIGIFFLFNSYMYKEKQVLVSADYKKIEFVIDGQPVRITDDILGAKNTTRYFGNELEIDLDGDGHKDVVFIVTQDHGGSDGYFLGDRIAPQSTTISPNPRHKNVVVFNYADRPLGEPVTAQPSLGKSVYLKLDPITMRWGIVEPHFEGETR